LNGQELSDRIARKARPENALVAYRRSLRGCVGFTNGCFDLLHVGHVLALAWARERCDFLIVGVNSDSSVREAKGEGRPVTPLGSRIVMLTCLELVDAVISFDEATPERLICALNPDRLFKGEDWRDREVAGAAYVQSNGGSVLFHPRWRGASTTGIVERIRSDAPDRPRTQPIL